MCVCFDVCAHCISQPQECGVHGFSDASMQQVAQSLFSRHGSLWARQSLRAQQALQDQARVHIDTRYATLRKEYDSLESERRLILGRIDAVESEEGPAPLCMSAATLTDRDLETWGAT